MIIICRCNRRIFKIEINNKITSNMPYSVYYIDWTQRETHRETHREREREYSIGLDEKMLHACLDINYTFIIEPRFILQKLLLICSSKILENRGNAWFI
jgi:hypothetical protein